MLYPKPAATRFTTSSVTPHRRTTLWRCLTAVFTASVCHSAVAGPEGGLIVGGSGNISQSGLNTTINQASQNMAIDWNSFNVNSNERVQFIQPNVSSIALNRILGSNASQINGRIDANGQIVLVNPHGVFFGQNASVNVGSLIASGLDISPVDFMNGNYIFNEVIGTDGAVINSGTINASLGGNVALLGRRVENNGLISATLGTVNLAAGKQAVLTFDTNGFLGVGVSKEILQNELGVDPALINSGEINAAGGRVLLTASVSQDIFSQAVNTGDIHQARSVVMHADGTFTLSRGADVSNTGVINVSTIDTNQNAGQIVLLGENVTSSGVIKADAINGNGGDIELHATDTTLLSDNSITSAISATNGTGGIVKILGNHVGLLDQSTVDVSGADGGGTALIGGDYQGNNTQIRNADRTYVSTGSTIQADATNTGNGGQIIVWANDITRYYGSILARGGVVGDGGFAEVSGKDILDFNGAVNLFAAQGNTGTLLLDPWNITIANGGMAIVASNDAFTDNNNGSVSFDANLITNILTGSGGATAANVVLQARNDIWVREAITVTTSNTNSLTLEAADDIQIDQAISLTGGSITISANDQGCTGNCRDTFDGWEELVEPVTGSSVFLNANLATTGGNIDLSGDFIYIAGNGATRQISTGAGAGNITINDTVRNVALNTGDSRNSLTLNAGTGNVNFVSGANVGNASTYLNTLTVTNASSVNFNAINTGSGGINITADTINLNGNLNSDRSTTAGAIALSGNVVLGGDITLDAATGSNGSTVTVTGTLNADAVNNNRQLTIAANTGAVNLQNAIGATQRLAAFTIDSAGAVTLGGNINSNAVTVTQSNSFDATGFNINTFGSGTANGGDVSITASGAINIADINTSAADITSNNNAANGGDVVLTAASITVGAMDTQGGSKSGDDRDGGAAGRVTLISTGTSTTNSAIVVNGVITATGGTGTNNGGAGGAVTLSADRGVATTSPEINVTNTINSSGGNSGGASGETGGAAGVIRITASDTNVNTAVTGSIIRLDADLISNGGSGGLSGNTGASATALVNLSDINRGTVSIGYISDFSAALNIIGSATGIDTLTGAIRTNNWNLSGSGSGYLNTPALVPDPANTPYISFTQIDNLTGNSGTDNFFITNNGALSGVISGGSGTDTLTGDALANTWTITALNQGRLGGLNTANSQTYGFTGLENLVGNTGTDAFVISGGGRLDGSINGVGATGNTLTGDNIATTWTISSPNAVSLLSNNGVNPAYNPVTGNVSNIQSLVGGGNNDTFVLAGGTLTGTVAGGSGTDTLVADNLPNSWTITAPDHGQVTGIFSGAADGFDNIENLTGNLNIDTFIFNSTGTLTGLIDSNTGAANSITLNGPSAVTVQLGASLSTPGLLTNGFIDVANIGTLNGNAALSNTLIGANATQTWTISGTNDGSVGGVSFYDFQNLTGGSLGDTFVFGGASQLDGLIDGGLSADSVDLTTFNTVTVQLGNVVTADQNINNVETITARNTNGNTLIGANSSYTWNIDGDQTGTVNSTRFINFDTLTGGALDDTFSIPTQVLASRVMINGGTAADPNNRAHFDTLTGPNYAATWLINAASSSNPTPTLRSNGGEVVIDFTNIENLTGGTANDTFNFIDTLVDGLVTGGAGTGADILDYSNFNSAVDLQLVSVLPATVIASNPTLYANGFETVNGNGNNTITSRIVGDNANNNWFINGNNSGYVTNLNTGSTLNFSGINELVGNAGVDAFEFLAGGSLRGMISGGGDTDSLIAYSMSSSNNWRVTAANAGSLNTNTLFSEIESLIGSGGVDTFVLSTPSFNGSIVGNGVSNTLTGYAASATAINNWNLTGPNNGTLNTTTVFSGITTLNGSLGVDNFTMNAAGFTGTINGGNGIDTLTGFATTANEINNWNLTAANSGNLNTATGFSGIDILNGNIGQDNFTLGVSSFSGTLNGGTGNDTLTGFASLASDVNSWNISEENQGSLNTTTLFTGVENLTGNMGQDNFVLNVASFNGQLNGGAGGIDAVTGFAILATDINTWNISSANNGSLNTTTGFTNMDVLNGNIGQNNFVLNVASFSGSVNGGTGSDTLTGFASLASDVNSWAITAANQGSLNTNTLFTGVDNLLGSIGQDNFVLYTPSFAGVIDGATGSNALTGYASLVTDINNWAITALNRGTLNITTDFRNIAALNGGLGIDQFVLANGSLSGSITGGNGPDSVQANNTNNSWLLSAVDSGTVTGISGNFSGMESLIGGTAIDTLTAMNSSNTWDINSANGGTLNTVLGFAAMENLVGGTLDDTFNVNAAGDVGGLINGNTGADILNLTNAGNAVTVTLGGALVTANSELAAPNNFLINNFEQVNASSTQSNTLIGANANQLWIIAGLNAGAVGSAALLDAGIPAIDTEGVTQFNGFGNIRGGSGDDAFRLESGSSLSSLRGGAHVNGDTIDLSRQTVVSVNISDVAATGYAELEGYRGNNTNSTLIASNASNLWTITSNNDGTVLNRTANPDTSFTFEDFNILIGGTLNDDFVVNAGGSLIDLINANPASGMFGGAGDDTLTVNLHGLDTGGITLFDGGADLDSITLQNDVSGSTGFDLARYTPDATNLATPSVIYDFINYANSGSVSNSYAIRYLNSEQVQDNVTANTLLINGTSYADVITLSALDFSVSTVTTPVTVLTTVDYSNKENVTIVSGLGVDTVTLGSNINLGMGDLELNAEVINNQGLYRITADNLLLDNVQSVDPLLSGQNLLTDVNTLSIVNSTSTSDTLLINEANNITLAAIGAVGTLQLMANGNITQSNALTSAATINLQSVTGNIELANAANTLSGVLSLLAPAGNITLSNLGTTNIELLNAGNNLTINSTGNIDDGATGVVTVANMASLTAGTALAPADILFNNANNIFNSLTVSAANNLDVYSTTSLTLNEIRATTLINMVTEGQILDGNGAALNLVSTRVNLTANSGINGLQTATANYDVTNQGGVVNLTNTGALNIIRLQNNGNISLLNDATITVNPGSVNANRNIGTLYINVTNGNILGGGSLNLANPDITALHATLFAFQGSVGTFGRPLVMDVPGDLLIQARSSVRPYFSPAEPTNFVDNSLQQFSSFDTISALSGQQLIEVETLAEVDPAIFTSINMYSLDDISVRMPKDQSYEDEDDNESQKEEDSGRLLQE